MVVDIDDADSLVVGYIIILQYVMITGSFHNNIIIIIIFVVCVVEAYVVVRVPETVASFTCPTYLPKQENK